MVLAYVIYRWIFRRAFVRMPDHSMAVLLERRFGQFHDSLVTAVELAEQPGHAEQFNQDMLAHTRQEAQSRTADVRVRRGLSVLAAVDQDGVGHRPCWRPSVCSMHVNRQR